MTGLASRRWLVLATAVNSLGSGAYLPISLVLLTRVSGLALTTVGLLVTVTSLASLAAMPYGGVLIDRIGARSIQRAAHLARAAGFLAYPLTHSVPAFAAVALVVAVADRISRVGQPALIAAVTTGADRDRYLATNRSLTNAGLGLGGVVVTALLIGDGRTPYVLACGFNALSFAAAALFVTLIAVPGGASTARGANAGASYRTILRHGRFRQLTIANACSAFSYSALSMLIPLYAIKALHTPDAFAGSLFTLNTILCAVGGVPVTSWLARHNVSRSAAARGGLALMTLAFALMAAAAFVPGMPLVMGLMVTALCVYTLGELAHSPSSTAQALAVASDAERGRYMAVYQVSWAVAAALAPALFTALISAQALMSLALLSVLNGAAILLLGRAEKPDVDRSPVAVLADFGSTS